MTGVWVGFDKPRTIISNGFAGELAVPMWARFMKAATANDKPDTFKMAEGLTVGLGVPSLRASFRSPACDRVVTEYFARGTTPTEMCDQHGFSTSGQLAAMFPGSTTNGNAGSVADVPPPPVNPPTPLSSLHRASSVGRRHGGRYGRRAEKEARVLGPRFRPWRQGQERRPTAQQAIVFRR